MLDAQPPAAGFHIICPVFDGHIKVTNNKSKHLIYQKKIGLLNLPSHICPHPRWGPIKHRILGKLKSAHYLII